MHLRTAPIVLAFGLLSSSALADPPGKTSLERKTAIDLVRLVTPPEVYEQMLAQMIAGMLPVLEKQGLPPGSGDKFKKALREIMPYEELLSWTADVYAARFTVPEMKELSAFYKRPVGRKLAKLLPELSGEAGKKMAELLPARLPAALQKYGLMPEPPPSAPH